MNDRGSRESIRTPHALNRRPPATQLSGEWVKAALAQMESDCGHRHLQGSLTTCKIASMLPSPKEIVVLELLVGEAELYGLQMVDASQGALKRGTIYVTLSRMEKKRYVESWLEETALSQGPPRRLYRITSLGRSALRTSRMVDAALRAEHAL